jgi:hypothetical protein
MSAGMSVSGTNCPPYGPNLGGSNVDMISAS